MSDDDFPVDPDALTLTFPCYFLLDPIGSGFYAHRQAEGGYLLVLLTDEDTLNSYRHDLGVPERGAVRFDNAQQLLAVVRGLPPDVIGISLDLKRRSKGATQERISARKITWYRQKLEAAVQNNSGTGNR